MTFARYPARFDNLLRSVVLSNAMFFEAKQKQASREGMPKFKSLFFVEISGSFMCKQGMSKSAGVEEEQEKGIM